MHDDSIIFNNNEGVEILSEYLIGNTVLKELRVNGNRLITDKSVPHMMDIAKKSCINCIDLLGTSISKENQRHILVALKIPIEQREIPIKSNTKSATKISST